MRGNHEVVSCGVVSLVSATWLLIDQWRHGKVIAVLASEMAVHRVGCLHSDQCGAAQLMTCLWWCATSTLHVLVSITGLPSEAPTSITSIPSWLGSARLMCRPMPPVPAPTMIVWLT